MEEINIKVLAFGEVLWDVFPMGKKLGGAPMNFCAHMSKLGAESFVITSVGSDELGNEILESTESLNINQDFIFIDQNHITGVCDVICDEKGEPSYNLLSDTSYDNITVTEDIINKINKHKFDILYFGTLAQRNEKSRETLQKLISNCRFKEIFCDVNLRQNFYSKEIIQKCLINSSILKINRAEYEVIMNMGLSKRCEFKVDCYKKLCKDLCGKYNIKIIIITLDSDGAIAYSFKDDTVYISKKTTGKVVSAVGAGDSFSACFLYNYMMGSGIQENIERANILGNYVVGFDEAIPDYCDNILSKIKQ